MIRSARIPAAPSAPFQTTFAGFVEERLGPLVPSEPIICRYHRELMRYVNSVDPLFITRKVAGQNRGEIVTTCDGTRLRPSDNSPAWYWHVKMFHGASVSGDHFAEFVETTPTHLFQVSRYDTVNTAGWHAAHILDAKNGDTDWQAWTRVEATRRFLRNIHPLNLFCVPKAEWHRLGRDPELVGYVASVYAKRWPEIWAEFTAVAGVPAMHPNAGDRILRIDRARPRSRETSWDFVLENREPRRVPVILSAHPNAEVWRRQLVKGLTLERFVALGNVLHNYAREGALRALAPNDLRRQAEIAFGRIGEWMNGRAEQWIAKQYRKPSGWTETIESLREGAADALKMACRLDLAGLATAALRIVDGPYRTFGRR